MADYSPLNLVPRGLDGTGAAYVLDQNTATAPTRMAERMAYRQQLRAAAEAARQQKQAQAEAARLAAITLSGQPGAYWIDDDKKAVNEFLSLSERVAAGDPTAGGEAALRQRQQALIAQRGQSVAASTELDKLLAQLTPENGFTPEARVKAVQAVRFNPDGTPRDPAAAMAALPGLDPYNPDWMDGAAVKKKLRDQLRLSTSEVFSGGKTPGSALTSRTYKDFLPPKIDPVTKRPVTDPTSGLHVPDFDNPATLTTLDSNRGARAFIDQYQREMSAASGATVPRAVAAEAWVGDALRGDVTTSMQYRPYGPQGSSKAADKPAATDWTPTSAAGTGYFGAHGYKANHETITTTRDAAGNVIKKTQTANLDSAPSLLYNRLATTFAGGSTVAPAVEVQLSPGAAVKVLPNGRRMTVKVATTAKMQNPSVEFAVVRKDGVPFLGKEVDEGDEAATVEALKRQIDQAARSGGAFQMSIVGDVADKDAVAGDGTGSINRPIALRTDPKTGVTTPIDDPLRASTVTRTSSPMSQAVAGQLARRTPGYNAYAFTPAQRELLQYAVDKGVKVRGIPAQYLPAKSTTSAPKKLAWDAPAAPAKDKKPPAPKKFTW